MRPILLYDGHCNFCIKITKILEFINKNEIKLIAFQSATKLKTKYHLLDRDLERQIHLIFPNGYIYQGGEAIGKLAKYFPKFKLFFSFFNTIIGKKIYQLLSNNRYRIFGCSKACYVSKYV